METIIETKQKDALTIPTTHVMVDERLYKFNVAVFNFNGQKVLADDASIDKDMLNEIVAIEGQGILTEIF